MKVEIFHSPSCGACVVAHEELWTVAREVVKNLEWHVLNVLDRLDYAVELGVLTLPSIVIDGELVFTSMPTMNQLRAALVERTGDRP